MACPIVADSLRPALTTETKGSACSGRAGTGGRIAAGFTTYTSQQMTEGTRPMMITTTKNAHHQRSIDVISAARPRENPRFDIGLSADRKKWKKPFMPISRVYCGRQQLAPDVAAQ